MISWEVVDFGHLKTTHPGETFLTRQDHGANTSSPRMANTYDTELLECCSSHWASFSLVYISSSLSLSLSSKPQIGKWSLCGCLVYTAAIRPAGRKAQESCGGTKHVCVLLENASSDSFFFSVSRESPQRPPILGYDGRGPSDHCQVICTHWALLGSFSQVFIFVVTKPGDRLWETWEGEIDTI